MGFFKIKCPIKNDYLSAEFKYLFEASKYLGEYLDIIALPKVSILHVFNVEYFESSTSTTSTVVYFITGSTVIYLKNEKIL